MSDAALSQKTVNTRKQHKCIWCGETIEIGEQCVVDNLVFEGEFQSNRYHPECNDAASDYCHEWCDEGFDPYQNPRGGIAE